jgi:hypothetical protein
MDVYHDILAGMMDQYTHEVRTGKLESQEEEDEGRGT